MSKEQEHVMRSTTTVCTI